MAAAALMPADTTAKDSSVGEEAGSVAHRDDDTNATAKKLFDHAHQPTVPDIRAQMSPCLPDEPLFRTSLMSAPLESAPIRRPFVYGQENPVAVRQNSKLPLICIGIQ